MEAIDELCMKKVPIQRVTLASIESLAIPLVQEVVFLADYRSARCRRRVAAVMSRMNGETDSVMISVLEKKISITCKVSRAKNTSGQQSSMSNALNKFTSIFVTLFLPSHS
ncbi:unnamed protein product [Cuscuta europaea]|uniref:Uncharacterized protein n=1 Tax=Cuscuta europaea TaxID=41803 RepID=A0A9P0ZJ88_CUSEU|nr:unnamed protein product [Cuscuta europaea]